MEEKRGEERERGGEKGRGEREGEDKWRILIQTQGCRPNGSGRHAHGAVKRFWTVLDGFDSDNSEGAMTSSRKSETRFELPTLMEPFSQTWWMWMSLFGTLISLLVKP